LSAEKRYDKILSGVRRNFMLKRDTRVQIVILENGKYILLKHHFIKENKYFWGVPGGGLEAGETIEEAAIREAWEETGLKVKLLPFSFEKIFENDDTYRRSVTLLAFPLEGTAATGYEPEEENKGYFELVDIKWQDFYDTMGIGERTDEVVEPFREIIDSDEFIKRAGTVIYKIEESTIYYLLVSAFENNDLFVLPQGHLERGETAEDAALREAEEEAGIICEIKGSLGFFIHEQKGKYYKTDIFEAEYRVEKAIIENRKSLWLTLEDALKLELLRETRLLINKCEEILRAEVMKY
jgi:8-oxo-dGTP pyrophosphatase MutT (NUDIX family)